MSEARWDKVNKARRTRERRVNARAMENAWLARKLKERLDASGLSAERFFAGLCVKSGSVHYSFLLNGRRGLTFAKAVRLATAANIDLSELQREVANE